MKIKVCTHQPRGSDNELSKMTFPMQEEELCLREMGFFFSSHFCLLPIVQMISIFLMTFTEGATVTVTDQLADFTHTDFWLRRTNFVENFLTVYAFRDDLSLDTNVRENFSQNYERT